MYEFAKRELGNRYTVCYNAIFKTEDSEERGLEVSNEDFLENFHKFVMHHLLDTDMNAPVERTTEQLFNLLFGDRSKCVCDFSDCRNHWLCVIANGDIYPCDRVIDKYRLGNIKDFEKIDDVFNTDAYKMYSDDIDSRLSNYCSKCSYYQFCQGGCNSRHAYYGDTPINALVMNLLPIYG